MKHIQTLSTRDLKESMKKGGCGECQTSCQSACKTSCTVGNQSCDWSSDVCSSDLRQDKHPLVSVEMRGNISSEHIAAYYAFSFRFRVSVLETDFVS